jgi:hypothetical protein
MTSAPKFASIKVAAAPGSKRVKSSTMIPSSGLTFIPQLSKQFKGVCMMGKMGRYCKAYPLARMREFSAWEENTQAFRPTETQNDNQSATDSNGANADENRIVYLQENYTVTDGIFLDENVIADKVTPEWIDFCHNNLKFELPEHELKLEHASESAA